MNPHKAKVKLEIRKIESKSILYKLNVPYLPFRWGANPYRGCLHDCWYCYARYSHEYLQLPMDQFQHVVFAKINADQVLAKELRRSSWKRELVNLGTVTDPYQAIERKYRVSRRMVSVFRENNTPLVISTKSPFILDDLELLAEFSSELFLNVVISITTMNEPLKHQLEPSTSTVISRLKAIEELAKKGIVVGVIMSPIFPSLTDKREQMAAVAQAASNAGASYFLADTLQVRRTARQYLFPYLKDTFPEIWSLYQNIYRGSFPSRKRMKEVRTMWQEIAAEYGIDHFDKMKYQPQENQHPKQLSMDFSTNAEG